MVIIYSKLISTPLAFRKYFPHGYAPYFLPVNAGVLICLHYTVTFITYGAYWSVPLFLPLSVHGVDGLLLTFSG